MKVNNPVNYITQEKENFFNYYFNGLLIFAFSPGMLEQIKPKTDNNEKFIVPNNWEFIWSDIWGGHVMRYKNKK